MHDVAAATRAHVAKSTTKSSCHRCLDLNFQFSRRKNKYVVSAIEYRVQKGLSVCTVQYCSITDSMLLYSH